MRYSDFSLYVSERHIIDLKVSDPSKSIQSRNLVLRVVLGPRTDDITFSFLRVYPKISILVTTLNFNTNSRTLYPI